MKTQGHLQNNGASNINCRATAKDIAECCTKGIKVDNEGPILENIALPTVMTSEL